MAEINSTSIDSLPVTIAEGGRNKALYHFGVRLKKEHQSPSTITDLMLQANKTHCNPPMEDDEINRIIRNVLNLGSNKPLGPSAKENPFRKYLPTFPPPNRPHSSLRHYSLLMISLLSTLVSRKALKESGSRTASPSPKWPFR